MRRVISLEWEGLKRLLTETNSRLSNPWESIKILRSVTGKIAYIHILLLIFSGPSAH